MAESEIGFTSEQKGSLYLKTSCSVWRAGGVVSLRGLKILFSPRAACDPTDTCYRIPPQKERGRDGARGKTRRLGWECNVFTHSGIFVFQPILVVRLGKCRRQHLKWIKKVHQRCPKARTGLVQNSCMTWMKGFDPLQM